MIITQLNGGLGNQMFQYAVGRCLAIKLKTELKLDVLPFDTYKLRQYELSHYHIQECFASAKELAIFYENRSWRKKFLLLKGKFLAAKLNLYQEKAFTFDSSVFSLSDGQYLRGYWQSEKYFKEIEEQLRRDFVLKEKLSEASQGSARKISSQKCPVSLHIRRGDYVTSKQTNQVHGTCSLMYYKDCLMHLKKHIDDFTLFVFSDDPEWVKENLKFDVPMIYVTHNGAERAYEDMHLMSLCRHHIIANSSFSWWGAWLNSNKKKMVFTPRKWFNDESISTKDLIPENWIRK